MAVLNCRHFNGYKPCDKNHSCDSVCPHQDLISENILLVHLGALGSVVRSTALLKPIRRKHPKARLIWVTDPVAVPLLKGHPLVDEVVAADFNGLMHLQCFQFGTAYVVDKSLKAAGLVKSIQAKRVKGFTAQQGQIIPATPEANELWRMGLNDDLKFFKNQKSEIQLVTEALDLDFRKDDYILPLHNEETELAKKRWQLWSNEGRHIVVGINTGCSHVIPYKKFSVEYHRNLIQKLKQNPAVKIVLLGGREDTKRNQQIAYGLDVIESPTRQGLRDGLVSVAACDIIVTGDSLGMHMAISQKKWIVAWFGPTCAHEIEIYGRGVSVLSKAPCGPCWKRSCQKDLMCYDQVELSEILSGVEKGIQFCQQTLSSKPPFLEMSF